MRRGLKYHKVYRYVKQLFEATILKAEQTGPFLYS